MPDPDLEIKGGRSYRPLDKGAVKNKEGEVGPPDPSPGSTTAGGNVPSIRGKFPALASESPHIHNRRAWLLFRSGKMTGLFLIT